jgi:hypothetical protein
MPILPRLLAALLCLPLAACQSPGLGTIPTLHGSDGAGLPYSLPAPEQDFSHFESPPRLAGLAANGQISHPDGEQGWRQWRYQGDGITLRLTLYGLPGGWQDLSPTRIVAGHYGQLRQARVDRVYHSRDQAILFRQERLFDLEGRQTASAMFIINETGRTPLYETLLLTIENHHFIRLEAASRQHQGRALQSRVKRALAEFRAAQRHESTNPATPSTAMGAGQ